MSEARGVDDVAGVAWNEPHNADSGPSEGHDQAERSGVMVIADPCVDAEGRAGRRAASRGKEAKDAVLGVLKERELRPKRNEMIGTSLMGSAERSDFYLDDLPQFPDGLAIKVRSQFTSGTADEKLFGLAANIKATYECPTVVVLGGDGFRPLIVEWLRSQVGGRLLAVLTIEEFGAWAASNL